MEKKPPIPLTTFDRMVTDDFLQMIKILIPYLPSNLQHIAGIYVKMTEFTNAISIQRYPHKQNSSMESIFEDMQPYLPENSKQMFSEFQQFFDMFDMMQNVDFNDIMQSMDFGDIFQTERNDTHERMDESSPASES